MNKKKYTCNRVRVLGNAGMAAGFLLLCVALEVGIMAEKAAAELAAEAAQLQTAAAGGGLLYGLNWFLPRAGLGLLIGGFLCKLLLWRCPACGCHLMLCVRGDSGECPCCKVRLEKETILRYNVEKREGES